ncbi:MAG: hypothetical protein VX589_04550 [Myxococcota bacterium]|nr:hypothetical protein [Myxococcota bacterium]
MYDRFPELKTVPTEGTPPNDGFLDGVFFLGNLCALVYVLVFVALALLLSGLPYASKLLTNFCLAVCIGGPIVWAIFVPGGLWTMLLPVLAPAAILAFFINRYAAARDRHPIQVTAKE